MASWLSGTATAVESSPKKTGVALTAAQIVAKNVTARGGLAAWRKVQTMVWSGTLLSTRTPSPSMSFLLGQKRPNKTRFELHAPTEQTVRVFDGGEGWKTRSPTDAQPSVQPYTPEEVRYARGERAIDAPLIDLEAQGATVKLAGAEALEGHKAYHLSVRLGSGEPEEVWVDAKTFLDVKVARMTYGRDGTPRMVPRLYGEYRNFEGLQIPTVIQIGDGTTGTPDRLHIEHVALNLELDDQLFQKPGTSARNNPFIPFKHAPNAARHIAPSDPIAQTAAASPEPDSPPE